MKTQIPLHKLIDDTICAHVMRRVMDALPKRDDEDETEERHAEREALFETIYETARRTLKITVFTPAPFSENTNVPTLTIEMDI